MWPSRGVLCCQLLPGISSGAVPQLPPLASGFVCSSPVRSQRGGNTQGSFFRALCQLCFNFCVSCTLLFGMLAQPRRSQKSIPEKNHFSVLSLNFLCLCHDMHQAFLSFPFNFLAMFVCLFEFRFFFSWFHWWIWSISSLPCQWKTHQPFVQADIPVSIICAKRLHLLLGFMAQGYHVKKTTGVSPPCRLHGRNEQIDTRRGEFLSSRIILNFVASKNLAFHVWGSPKSSAESRKGSCPQQLLSDQ